MYHRKKITLFHRLRVLQWIIDSSNGTYLLFEFNILLIHVYFSGVINSLESIILNSPERYWWFFFTLCVILFHRNSNISFSKSFGKLSLDIGNARAKWIHFAIISVLRTISLLFGVSLLTFHWLSNFLISKQEYQNYHFSSQVSILSDERLHFKIFYFLSKSFWGFLY